MSDFEDDDFMHDDEYEFEYEDDDDDDDCADGGGDMDDEAVDLENQYYRAKEKKERDAPGAIQDFLKVVADETTSGEWGMKALKQVIKLSFKLQQLDHVIEYYDRLLQQYTQQVTKNYSEKSINNLLDLLGTSTDLKFLERVYQLTLEELTRHENERLFIKTNLKLAKLWLDRREYTRMQKIVRRLREQFAPQTSQSPVSATPPGLADSEAMIDPVTNTTSFNKRGTHLLEIYALEIQMYTETKNNKKLKQLYQQCLAVKAAIPHPRIMGIVYECGGKMHMSQKEWNAAQQDFFEAFKNYDEAGSAQRINCLKYLVLANMLAESDINPFDSQETKPYKNNPHITAMTNLVSAYQRKEIWEFEKILSENKADIMEDPFIKMYIEGVLWNIRSQVLLQLVKPYKSIRLDFLSKQIGYSIDVAEVQEIIITLIMDEKLQGRIDQLEGILYLDGDMGTRGHSQNVKVLLEGLDSLKQLMDIKFGQPKPISISSQQQL